MRFAGCFGGALGEGGAEKHDRRVKNDEKYKPLHICERQRLYNFCGDDYARNSAESESERGFWTVTSRFNKTISANRHQECARSHHDRKCCKRAHAEQIDHDHARGVESDAKLLYRAETKVRNDRDPKFCFRKTHCVAADWKPSANRSEHEQRRRNERDTQTNLNATLRPVADRTCANPRS